MTDVAVIVSSNDYFEIWNQSSWEEEKVWAESEFKAIDGEGIDKSVANKGAKASIIESAYGGIRQPK